MIMRILSGLTLRDSGMETKEHDQAIFFLTEYRVWELPLATMLGAGLLACAGKKKGKTAMRRESLDELAQGVRIGGGGL